MFRKNMSFLITLTRCTCFLTKILRQFIVELRIQINNATSNLKPNFIL